MKIVMDIDANEDFQVSHIKFTASCDVTPKHSAYGQGKTERAAFEDCANGISLVMQHLEEEAAKS